MSDDYLMLTVADGVAALLATVNDGLPADEEAIPLAVERRFPDFDLELESIPAEPLCDVVPIGILSAAVTSRATLSLVCSVDIAIRGVISASDQATGGAPVASVDSLVKLSERVILHLLRNYRLTDYAYLDNLETIQLVDKSRLRQKQFFSHIRVHYAVSQDIDDS